MRWGTKNGQNETWKTKMSPERTDGAPSPSGVRLPALSRMPIRSPSKSHTLELNVGGELAETLRHIPSVGT